MDENSETPAEDAAMNTKIPAEYAAESEETLADHIPQSADALAGDLAEPVGPPPRSLMEAARDLALAAVGMVSVLRDEGPELYRRSVARGESDVRRLQEQISQLQPGGAGEEAAAGAEYSAAPSEGWRKALGLLGLATPADVDALTRQIAELESKIDQLAAKQAG
jgi:hypothetical protein